VDIQLQHLRNLLAAQFVTLSLTDSAKKWIADDGYDPVYGARPLKRSIQVHLQNTLAEKLLVGDIAADSVVTVDVKDDALTFNVALKGADAEKSVA